MLAPVTLAVEIELLEALTACESTDLMPVPDAPGFRTTGAPSWPLVGVVDTRTVMACDAPAARSKPDHVTFCPLAPAVPVVAETETIETPAGMGSVTEIPLIWYAPALLAVTVRSYTDAWLTI